MKKLIQIALLGLLLTFAGIVGMVGSPAILADESAVVIQYPEEIVSDFDKLCAVYSLLEQMRLEHNEAGAIASLDWEKYQDQWYIYAKKFDEKQKPLLVEYVRLKEAIRKDTYTDAEWGKLTVDQTADALEILYGDKEVLKELPTLATSDLLDQLKAIDFLALKGVAPPDPLEDWTTYTEDDGDGFIGVTANTLTITNMDRPGSYLYYDFTANHFGTTLINPHLVSAEVTGHSGTAVMLLFHTLSNTTTPGYYTDPVIMCYFYPSNEDIHVTIDDGATDQTDNWGNYVENTRYYFTFDRDAGGTSLKIYSDASRTTLVDTLAVAQGTTSFQYLHSVAPLSGAGTDTISAKVYDLDLQEAGVSVPTVTSDNSTLVEETTATVSGNITATGGDNCTDRMFHYGTTTGVYTDNVTEAGNFGVGVFNNNLVSLSPGTTYYWVASANNSAGRGYGDELFFTTKPQAPTALTDTTRTDTQITLTWTLGAGSENTTIRYRSDGTYPTDYTDGTLGYSGTAATCNLTGLSPGQEYKIGAWAVNTDNTTIYSDSSAQVTAFTLPADPANLAVSNPDCTTIDADWTKGTGGDKTHIRYNTGSYPATVVDGTQGYFDTDNTTTIVSLSANTTYYFRGWAYDTDSGYYSAGYTQTTGNTTAITLVTVVTTDNATGITSATATVSGNLTDADCENATYRGFEWDTDGAPFTDNWTENGSFGTGVFSHEITGLLANTTYFFRAIAWNSAGWAYGATGNFTTAVAPPAVPLAPSCFTITDLGGVTGEAVWCASANTTGYLILVDRDNYPNDPNGDFEVAYSGNATSDNLTSYSLASTQYYFSLWSYNETGYSDTYLTATIGGENMTLLALGLIPLGLLITMFATRNPMLGFPATLFWAIFGGYAYTQSATPWGDWQYFVAFGSLLGMTTFSALAAYGLREKRDTIADEEMEQEENNGYVGDENAEADIFGGNGNSEPSERSRRLKERVARRRSKPMRKGEFDF